MNCASYELCVLCALPNALQEHPTDHPEDWHDIDPDDDALRRALRNSVRDACANDPVSESSARSDGHIGR